jgi:hypothetical protein
MRAEELLKVKESDLNVGRGLEKVAKLLVEDENTTVVGMLETVSLNVFVDRLSHGATRDKLTLGKPQKSTKLLGDLLLAVKSVILGALSGLLAVRVVELRLDLSDNLSERLKFITESGDLAEAGIAGVSGISRHYDLYKSFVFKCVDISSKRKFHV